MCHWLTLGVLLVLALLVQEQRSQEDEGTDRTGCPGAFRHLCHCGVVHYEGRSSFVVNCTNKEFTSADPLLHLPSQTEVLIFVGNHLAELPWNVFGQMNNYSELRVVDMSSNGIRQIKGKTYHKVGHVERLILNNNELNISESHHHPRIFSNFFNLRELHLTNAFTEGKWFLEDLQDIFLSSNLTHLQKLHLEQNEIVLLKNSQLFCPLPSLMDLHLGQNQLVEMSLDLSCLPNLRYLDLEMNQIQSIPASTLKEWDRAAAARSKNHTTADTLTINLQDNPYDCDCRLEPFLQWLKNTNVTILGAQKMRCHNGFPEDNTKKKVVQVKEVKCRTVPKSLPYQHATNSILAVLLSLVFVLVLLLVYMNRHALKQRLRPVVDTVTKRVRYTSIGKVDEPEVEV